MRDWLNVAELTNTKNLNGGLVARGAAGLLCALEPGTEVAFVPPLLEGPRRSRIQDVQDMGSDQVLFFFEGIEGIDVAEALVGSCVLVQRADLPDFDEDGLPFDWEGWMAFEVGEGVLGEVAGIQEMPMQTLLVIRRESGQDALIPLVDEFVKEVNEDERRIVLDLPAGLLEL